MTQILHETLQNNATLNLHFVESHQYKHALIHTLPLPVQLNIAANKLAGNRRFKQQSQTLMADLLPTTKIHLYFGASTVTGMYKSLLEQQYQRFVSIKYISQTNDWPERNLIDISFSAQRQAHKTLGTSITLLKLANNILLVNHHMHKCGQYHTTLCPVCNQQPKTITHLYHCVQYKSWREQFLVKLQLALHKLGTPTTMSHFIFINIKRYPNNEPPKLPPNNNIYYCCIPA